MYTFKQPGTYAYVNHNLIEAFNLGAAGHVRVDGEWNNDLMEQVKAPGPIGGAAAPAAEAKKGGVLKSMLPQTRP